MHAAPRPNPLSYAPVLPPLPSWMRLRTVPLGEDDALAVFVGLQPTPADSGAHTAIVLSEGAGGPSLRPVLTRYFEHVANQLRWQLPWLAQLPGSALVEPIVWYQWQPQMMRAGTHWPARLSRVVLAEHQGVYRYASWREAGSAWETTLIAALRLPALQARTHP